MIEITDNKLAAEVAANIFGFNTKKRVEFL